FTQAMTLWEIIRKVKPSDLEAQHKAKDLAASATIAKGGYEKVIHTNHAPATTEETACGANELAVVGTSSDNPAVAVRSPVEERCAREAAPLQARLQADPGSPGVYLQLATVYRRADLFDQARTILQQGLERTNNHFELALELADLDIEP